MFFIFLIFFILLLSICGIYFVIATSPTPKKKYDKKYLQSKNVGDTHNHYNTLNYHVNGKVEKTIQRKELQKPKNKFLR